MSHVTLTQTDRARIVQLLDSIVPGVAEISSALPPDQQLQQAVEANVRWAMRQILATPEGKIRAEEGRMQLIGAVYEIATGCVRLLD